MPYFPIEPCSLGNRSPNRLFAPHPGKELCPPKLGQRAHAGNTHDMVAWRLFIAKPTLQDPHLGARALQRSQFGAKQASSDHGEQQDVNSGL